MTQGNHLSAKLVKPRSAWQDERVLDCKQGIAYVGILPQGGVGWVEYEYSSSVAYEGVSISAIRSGPPYRYPVYVRKRAVYGIIASTSRAVVDAITSPKGVLRDLIRTSVSIHVHSLVFEMLNEKKKNRFESPDGSGARRQACVSFLQLETTGLKPALNSATLYGNDLSQSPLIQSLKEVVTFQRSGLRFPGEAEEFLRLGYDAMISFPSDLLGQGSDRTMGTVLEEILAWFWERGYLS